MEIQHLSNLTLIFRIIALLQIYNIGQKLIAAIIAVVYVALRPDQAS
jgi:hypothetical protein